MSFLNFNLNYERTSGIFVPSLLSWAATNMKNNNAHEYKLIMTKYLYKYIRTELIIFVV